VLDEKMKTAKITAKLLSLCLVIVFATAIISLYLFRGKIETEQYYYNSDGVTTNGGKTIQEISWQYDVKKWIFRLFKSESKSSEQLEIPVIKRSSFPHIEIFDNLVRKHFIKYNTYATIYKNSVPCKMGYIRACVELGDIKSREDIEFIENKKNKYFLSAFDNDSNRMLIFGLSENGDVLYEILYDNAGPSNVTVKVISIGSNIYQLK